jgi:thioesterase domain-containing protein
VYISKLGNECIFPTVEQLAASFIEDVRKVRAHGPYQLCGYSNAGLIAYEMAILLASEGEEVSCLALIDAWHPEFVRNLSLWELARYRTMRFVDRLKKYGQLVRHGQFEDFVSGTFQFVDKRAKLLVWRARGLLSRTEKRSVPQGMKVVESIISLRAYSPKAYPRRFVLIRPDDPADNKLNDQTVGWRVCATGGVDVHFVPARHGYMMNRAYVRAVLDKIVPYLATSQHPSGNRNAE